MTKQKKIHIALSGNIGAGKTVLTRILSKHLGWHAFYEKAFENPYLEKFYDEMPQFAFQVQIFFLIQRLKIHNEIKVWPGSCIQDRTIYEDAKVFVPVLHKLGFLTKEDYDTYNELYSLLSPRFNAPDLILYLKAPVEMLVHNILKRDRSFEQTIDRSYLEELNAAYEDWYRHERNEGKRIMLVDTKNSDFEEDSEKINHILKIINDLESQIWVEIA